jgi:hypothetical protein
MSSHRKKHNDRTMLYIVIGVIVLVLFMGVFGLNSLIGSSVLINNLFVSDEGAQDTGTGEDFFGTLSVDTPPLATNSARLIMTGTVTGFDTVEFYINEQKVDDARVEKDGTFLERIGDLSSGDNEIYVKATTKRSSKTKSSEIFDVSYQNQKPTLEVQEPQPDSTTNESEITVKGTTNASEAKINNGPVIVDAQGQFERSIRLQEGDNTITIYVEDDAGNTEQAQINVKYEKDED